MELIRVRNITKTYRVGDMDVPVLKEVSFSIKRGEMVAIMGASGSGKSTLMNILGCLDRPTSGEYWLDGQEVSQLERDQRAVMRTTKLGFVFQSFNLLARATAINNVLMPLDYSLRPPTTQAAHERAVELLRRIGLEERMEHVPAKMSGGQQQRVAIARSLVNQPTLLLADEPTGNLDSQTSLDILRMFQQLNAEGLTVILVTHDPEVTAFAHRMIRIADGRVVEDISTRPPASAAAAPVPTAASSAETGGGGTEPGQARSRRGGNRGGGTAVAEMPRVRAAEPVVPPPSAEPQRRTQTYRPSLASQYLPSTFRTALSAILRNKMRSGLTTLGVIIGVAAVIAMVEISQGSRTALATTMATMGVNTLMVQSGAATSGGITMGLGTEKTLTPEDAEAIRRDCPAIESAAPIVRIQGNVVRGNKNWIPMNIYGTIPEYLDVRDWNELNEGDMFSTRDVRGANRVCVIGETIRKELFGDESPIGKDLRIKNVTFRVMGVLSRKGANMMGMDQDDVILAPWTTIKYRVSSLNTGGATAQAASSETSSEVKTLSELYPPAAPLYPLASPMQAADTPQPVRFINVDTILVKARSAELIEAAIAQITALLHQRHRIHAGQEDDFNIRNMAEMLRAFGSMSTMMGGLLLIVALISLAVGGVGIMNIMLVSVTERTREIGLRMAVGARGYHILRQFLIEAVVLCAMGGIMGIVLGRAASLAVWWVMNWPVQVSISAVLGAFLVSAAVGIGFGFYPAWKASRFDPIEALRYE